MKPVAFVGPTLYGQHRTSWDSVDVAPPAACGDVLRAVDAGRKVIGLIDGTFESGPSVWHKEILYALSAGCQVFGAASMGALRAAECEAFGMVGVGSVFSDYRSGRRVADADVAVTFGPSELGYPPTSVALVDAEDCLVRLVAAGLISSNDCERGVAAAATLFFKDRSWEAIFERAAIRSCSIERLAQWLANSAPGPKTRDAIDLMDLLAAAPSLHRQTRRFNATLFFDLIRQVR